MATAAKSAAKVAFQRDTDLLGAYVKVAEVKSVQFGLKREVIDVTNLDSLEQWREKIKGLKDGGSITLDMNYIPGDGTQSKATGLLYDLDDDTVASRNYRMVWNGGPTWTLPAIVTDFTPGGVVDGAQTCSVTLQITGKPTLN